MIDESGSVEERRKVSSELDSEDSPSLAMCDSRMNAKDPFNRHGKNSTEVVMVNRG